MAKIMFFAHDPGGANAIHPLISPLMTKKHDVFVSAKGPALKILPEAREYDNQLANILPDFLITGTSSNDFTEKKLWVEAKKLRVRSLAILDHWMNYGIRFSAFTARERHNFNQVCSFLPDYICVMDEFAKEKMVQDGVPSEIIYPLGNPHFEAVLNQSKKVSSKKYLLVTEEEVLIVFASQPFYDDAHFKCEKSPEFIVLEHLIDIVENLDNVKILVKFHPKENPNKFRSIKSEKVFFNTTLSSLECVKSADVIVSVNSMLLIEGVIQGKKIISYQPNEQNKDSFFLTQNGTLPFINTADGFKQEILRLINSQAICDYRTIVKTNIANNIIDFVGSKICLN